MMKVTDNDPCQKVQELLIDVIEIMKVINSTFIDDSISSLSGVSNIATKDYFYY